MSVITIDIVLRSAPLPAGRDAAAVPQAAAPVETGGVGNPVTPPGMTTSRKRNNNEIPDRQH